MNPLNAAELGKPFNPQEFKSAGVVAAWEKYGDVLTWGKGQTVAVLDDCCDIDVPQWKVNLPWGAPKVVASWNSVENNDNPRPVGSAYHGTTVAYPSSLNYEGTYGVAFNNQIAPVRCATAVHLRKDESATIVKALEWVLENREKLNITAVNLSVLDDQKHPEDVASSLDVPLKALREAGVWVSAPCGNNEYTTGISWPAASAYCFAIGATNPGKGTPYRDRFSNTDILSPAKATSTANACLVGFSQVLREAIEKTGYDWKAKGETLPEAMMVIFRETGSTVHDSGTGLDFQVANLLNALDYIFAQKQAKS
jgi:hypothetical protein